MRRRGAEPPSALVMARTPLPGQAKARLRPLLGAEGCMRLQAVLLARAAAWAVQVAPGRAHVAFTPEHTGDEVAKVVGEGVEIFAQEGAHLGAAVRAASERVMARHAGPLLVVGTDVPALAADHAQAALSDLRDGWDVAIGPAAHGGCYLVGMSEPQPKLFGVEAEAWQGSVALARSLAEAQAGGLSVGLLRAERALRTPADARALLADPLTAADVRAALEGVTSVPHPG